VGHSIVRFAHVPARFAEQLPRYPKKEQSSRKDEPNDIEQLGREYREYNAQQRGCGNADHNCAPAEVWGKTGRSKTDYDRVVSRQDEVDHNNADERRQLCRQFRSDGMSPRGGRVGVAPQVAHRQRQI
jgi:hypothetical protein